MYIIVYRYLDKKHSQLSSWTRSTNIGASGYFANLEDAAKEASNQQKNMNAGIEQRTSIVVNYEYRAVSVSDSLEEERELRFKLENKLGRIEAVINSPTKLQLIEAILEE